jgi:dihydrodipicolinate synthase/N-acetylneuraminate lyase
MKIVGPIAPIPPSFSSSGELRSEDVMSYIQFLVNNGIKTLVTTEGTSQFALMALDEIREFNDACRKAAHVLSAKLIIGLPPLSDKLLASEIELANLHANPILLLYPDRYYDDKHIIDHFLTAANISSNPVLVHGRSIRGSMGVVDFSPIIVGAFAQHPTIQGMKEECSNHSASATMMTAAPHFSFIVAGGSCGRFRALRAAGATAFLSGVGSFAPALEIRFHDAELADDHVVANALLAKEERFFKTFMGMGWHKAMREALRQMGFLAGNRRPFPDASKEESERVATALALLGEP